MKNAGSCAKKGKNKELMKDCIEAPLAAAEVTDAGGLSLQILWLCHILSHAN